METGEKITIEQLAGMMTHSFKHLEKKMDEKFNKADEKFNKIDEKLDKVDIRLDTIEEKLERIENKVDGYHERRITLLEDSVRILKTAEEKGNRSA